MPDALLFGFSAQAASLFTHPCSGPTAAEGMIFGLGWYVFAGSVSAFLALSPLLLARTLLTLSRRASWRRVAVAGLLVVIVLGVAVGPRNPVSPGASWQDVDTRRSARRDPSIRGSSDSI